MIEGLKKNENTEPAETLDTANIAVETQNVRFEDLNRSEQGVMLALVNMKEKGENQHVVKFGDYLEDPLVNSRFEDALSLLLDEKIIEEAA